MKNSAIIFLTLFFCITAVLMNKSYRNQPFYGVQSSAGLPFDIDDRNNNRALIFTMTDEPGRTRNIELMKSVFEDGSLGFVCEQHHNKTSNEIYKRIKEVVSQMEDQGTLLLYLNSHGGGSGKNFGMTTSGGWFKFSKVLDSIASVKKIKRLVVLVDTCHAEGAINEGFQGGARLIKNVQLGMFELPGFYGGSKTPLFMGFFEDKNKVFYYGEDSGAYDEALIVTSSSAGDLSMRGTFASNFKKAFDRVKDQKDIKVMDFLRVFASLHSSGGQQPYYKSIPNSILNEPLFTSPLARRIPIVDRSKEGGSSFKKDYILVPDRILH